MADKVYKTPDELIEKEYHELSDKVGKNYLKGEKSPYLSPEEAKRYDEVKGKMSEMAKRQKPVLMPRDDAYKQKMAEFHAKRKELFDSDDDYLGPKWNALSDEIKKFRSGYEPSKIDSPHEYFLDNDLDEFQLDQVRDDISFQQLWDEMQKGNDIYKVASVDGQGFDSAVREKIFSAMADKLGLDYDDIYNTWLGRGKPVKTPSNPRYAVDNGNPNPKKVQSPTGTEAFKKVKALYSGLSDAEKEILKDLINFPRE